MDKWIRFEAIRDNEIIVERFERFGKVPFETGKCYINGNIIEDKDNYEKRIIDLITSDRIFLNLVADTSDCKQTVVQQALAMSINNFFKSKKPGDINSRIRYSIKYYTRIETIADLVNFSPRKLSKIIGLGPKAIQTIEEELAKYGLKLTY